MLCVDFPLEHTLLTLCLTSFCWLARYLNVWVYWWSRSLLVTAELVSTVPTAYIERLIFSSYCSPTILIVSCFYLLQIVGQYCVLNEGSTYLLGQVLHKWKLVTCKVDLLFGSHLYSANTHSQATHTCRRARTHARAGAHTCTHARVGAHARTDAHARADARTRRQHARAAALARTQARIEVHTRTGTYTRTLARTGTHACSLA